MLDIFNVEQIARDPLRGSLVENLVVSEFIKKRLNQVDKEKVDTNLWNLLSGGKRNAPSQPIQQLPVQPSPRKFKQQLRETRESDPWQTESSSTYVFYVTGDLGMFIYIYIYTHTHIHINHLTNQNNIYIYIYNNQ